MAHPLSLSYNWVTPVSVSSIGLIVCVGLLANSQATGWVTVAIVLAGMWVAFMVVVWLRTRAYMMVDGPMLTVRRFKGFATLDGRTVTAVTEFLTPSGPSYKVSTRDRDGQLRRQIVPAALLRTGHSTLFDWLLTWAPRAELDKGCRRTLDQLRTRGLIP
jgi:hypothetical protein